MSPERDTPIPKAQLVREYAIEGVEGTDAPLFGCTFADGRLLLASGRYLVRVAPDTGRIVDQFETFPEGGGLAYDGEHLWQRSQGCVQRLVLRTGLVERSVVLPVDEVTGFAYLERNLLILHQGGRRLTCFQVEERALSNEVRMVHEAEVGEALAGLAVAGRELWSLAKGALVRIDPATAEVRERMKLPAARAVCDVAVDGERRFYCVDGVSRTVLVFAQEEEAAAADQELPRWARQPASSRVVDVSSAERDRAAPRPAESPESLARGAFQRILVPIDFSSSSRRALATALFFQERLGSEVHLFRLGEQSGDAEFLAGSGANVSYGALARDARERVVRFVENVFPGRSSRVVVHSAVGNDLVAGIERAAREVGATLVLLAGRRKQTLFRTPIERVARDLEGAVMVLWADSDAEGSEPS